MDSGNSGSLQSSSGGGDYEYDSRSDQPPFAGFSNTNFSSASTFAPLPHHHQLQRQQLPSSPFFDSIPSYLDSAGAPSQPPPQIHPNPLLGLDMPMWAAETPSCTPLSPPPPQGAPRPSSSVPSPDQATGTVATPRGSKKRPRASKRAPTTVLTTDTSNFRQMVQEFTGIPTPPFSSLGFPRTRFDIFNSAAAAASAIRSSPGRGGALLRPFAQKMPTSSSSALSSFSNPFAPPSSSSSSSSSSMSCTSITISTNPTATIPSGPSTASGKYQPPTDLSRLTNQTQISLMQSQLLAYQSLFQSTTPPPSMSQNYNSPAIFGSKPQVLQPTTAPSIPGADDHHHRRHQEQFGLSTSIDPINASHTLTRLFGSDGTASNRGGGSSSAEGGGGLPEWGEWGDDATRDGRGGGRRNSQTHLSASPEFRPKNDSRSPENVSGDGTFSDSWICSPD